MSYRTSHFVPGELQFVPGRSPAASRDRRVLVSLAATSTGGPRKALTIVNNTNMEFTGVVGFFYGKTTALLSSPFEGYFPPGSSNTGYVDYIMYPNEEVNNVDGRATMKWELSSTSSIENAYITVVDGNATLVLH